MNSSMLAAISRAGRACAQRSRLPAESREFSPIHPRQFASLYRHGQDLLYGLACECRAEVPEMSIAPGAELHTA